MVESAVKWQSPEELANRRGPFPVGDNHVHVVEIRARVRATDTSLVGDPLVETSPEGLERRPGVAADTAAVVPMDLAARLIEDREVPSEVEERLAASYVVAVVRPWGSVVAPGAATVVSALPEGTLATRCDTGLVVLVPDRGERGTAPGIQALVRLLGGPAWVGTARGSRPLIAAAFRTAEEVTRLVAAVRRPSGVYRVHDVLVEYAVTRQEGIAAKLLAVIRPLRSHTVLWTTLVALVKADYVRNQAAKALFIHRSTLDYRLQRIAQVTGHDPTSGRGAQVLAAALIAHAMQ